MFTAVVAQAEDFDTRRAARTLIASCRQQLDGRTPAAALLFTSVQFDHAHILQSIDAAFPGIPLAGTTTAGEFSSGFGFTFDSAVLVLLCSDTVTFGTGYAHGTGNPTARTVHRAYAMAAAGLDADPALCLVFHDAAATDPVALTEELSCLVPPGCPVFGAIAASQMEVDEPARQFCNNGMHDDAVVVMLLAGPVQYDFRIANGWRPLGPRMHVTGSDGTWLTRIGDRTALEFYRHYLGPRASPAQEFPLAVYEPGSEDFYLRVPYEFDEETGGIRFRGHMPAGTVIQLTEAIRDRIIDDVRTAMEPLASPMGFNPALALVFSCRVRNLILGTRISHEYRTLAEVLPDGLPIAGLYSFGEFSPLRKGRRTFLHNSTMVTLLIGDAETPPPAPTKNPAPAHTLLMDAQYLARRLERVQKKRRRVEQQLDYTASMQRTIMDEVVQAREKIRQQNDQLQKLFKELEKEKAKSDQLLLNILPDDVAEELKATGKVEPVFFDSATVMFSDFKDFTRIAGRIPPARLVAELDYHFSWFDYIIEKHGLEKLKTIGDAYMCAGGLPAPMPDHALRTVRAALEMQDYMRKFRTEHTGPDAIDWHLRIGINTGPLMAGVIGKKKFAYDIWGDTVNIAARMETAGEPGRVNISESTHALVKDLLACEHRGRIHAKNKGEVDMYFISED